jgi:non-ribosomal peptide synthetase component F
LPTPAPQDAPCVINYTSGSTGRPKGIARSQRQMLVRAGDRIEKFRHGPSDPLMSLFSLSSGPGVTGCFTALLSGATLCLADVTVVGARGVLDAARDARITYLNATTALLRTLLAMQGAAAAFATLRNVGATSESVFRHDVERWRAVLPAGCGIRIGYGLTEGAPLADWFVHDTEGEGPHLPIGYPSPWSDYAITDPSGEPVRGDAPGELWARGRLLSLGEWRQGRCVPGRLLPDPDDPASAVLRTGDLVRLRGDRLLEFLGRIDDQMKIRGNRVEPAELERVLRETPAVIDAAVLPRRTARDPILVAFVVAGGADEAALRGALAGRLGAELPSYMLPSRLHVVAALPKLPGGKIDPAALARLDDAAVAEEPG